jgi:hypothetical protein
MFEILYFGYLVFGGIFLAAVLFTIWYAFKFSFVSARVKFTTTVFAILSTALYLFGLFILNV